LQPNLRGLLNVSGILIQARSTDGRADAILKAITKCRVNGDAEPDLVIVSASDWQTLALEKDANGNYYFGGRSTAAGAIEPSKQRVWGLRCVVDVAAPTGTALVLDTSAVALAVADDVTVSWAETGTDFTTNSVTVRAEARIGLAVLRPERLSP